MTTLLAIQIIGFVALIVFGTSLICFAKGFNDGLKTGERGGFAAGRTRCGHLPPEDREQIIREINMQMVRLPNLAADPSFYRWNEALLRASTIVKDFSR